MIPTIPGNTYFSACEVAGLLGVSVTTIYRELEAYRDSRGAEGLPFVWVRGLYRIARDDVLNYAARKPWEKGPPIRPTLSLKK